MEGKNYQLNAENSKNSNTENVWNSDFDTVKTFINEINFEPSDSKLLDFYVDKYDLTKNQEQDMDYDTGYYFEFEQFDGSMVNMNFEEKDGLRVLTQALISSSDKNHSLDFLEEFVPKGYKVLLEARSGKECMLSRPKVIILNPWFLNSIGGRLVALHEIGHAVNYRKMPRDRKDIVDGINVIDSLEREDSAWQEAKAMIEIAKEKAINILPDWFNDFEQNNFINECLIEHRYDVGGLSKDIKRRRYY